MVNNRSICKWCKLQARVEDQRTDLHNKEGGLAKASALAELPLTEARDRLGKTL